MLSEWLNTIENVKDRLVRTILTRAFSAAQTPDVASQGSKKAVSCLNRTVAARSSTGHRNRKVEVVIRGGGSGALAPGRIGALAEGPADDEKKSRSAAQPLPSHSSILIVAMPAAIGCR